MTIDYYEILQVSRDASGAEIKKSYRKLAIEINSLEITKKPVEAFVKQISGCQDTEYSYTGETNSAFTESLKYVWADGNFEGTYKDFYLQIREGLINQHPKLLEFGKKIAGFDKLSFFDFFYFCRGKPILLIIL